MEGSSLTKDNISPRSLAFDGLGVVEVAQDNPGVWVLRLDLLGLVLGADEERQLKIRELLGDVKQRITSNIARGARNKHFGTHLVYKALFMMYDVVEKELISKEIFVPHRNLDIASSYSSGSETSQAHPPQWRV